MDPLNTMDDNDVWYYGPRMLMALAFKNDPKAFVEFTVQ